MESGRYGSALGCAGQFQEIAQNIVPMGGSDAFRVELHAPDR
jgi:hypothetical protein